MTRALARARRGGAERGSLAIELAFLTPVLFVLLALVYAYGRVAQVNGTLEAGTRDAARSASQSRTYDEARERAERTIRAALGSTATSCLDSLDARIVGPFEAGEPVKVRARCTYSLSDLGLPGAPGSITVTSSFTSPLDPGRGVEERPGGGA